MEVKAYQCDGRCGDQVVLTKPAESLSERDWVTTYRERGKRPLHACSEACMIKALQDPAIDNGLPFRT